MMKKVMVWLLAVVLACASPAMSVCAQEELTIVTEESIADYFDEAVLVGDSVALGFSNYIKRNADSFLGGMQSLTCGGFGAKNAFKEISKDSAHPVYQGEKRYVWDSIEMMGAKHIFLSFGINDLNPLRDRVSSKYEELVDRILEQSPEADITIVSITYVKHGAESGRINNDFIRETNAALQELAAARGWGYLDVASWLADENGDLNAAYCSDGYVHLGREAYKQVWSTTFHEYVLTKLRGENGVYVEENSQITACSADTPVFTMPIAAEEYYVLTVPDPTLIQITGTAENGFYRVNLGDGSDYYIPVSSFAQVS